MTCWTVSAPPFLPCLQVLVGCARYFHRATQRHLLLLLLSMRACCSCNLPRSFLFFFLNSTGALDGFESDDDEEEEVGEVQLSPTEAHEDAVAPMTPPRPGTEPLPDATSPLIGQMLVSSLYNRCTRYAWQRQQHPPSPYIAFQENTLHSDYVRHHSASGVLRNRGSVGKSCQTKRVVLYLPPPTL